MADWKNTNELNSFKKLGEVKPVDLKTAMSGENGAKRVIMLPKLLMKM